jgi:hypothetical protein
VKWYGPERAEENGADIDYRRALDERKQPGQVDEDRFFATLRNLERHRHLTASVLDELIKANEQLRKLRIVAGLIALFLLSLIFRFWR